MVGSEKNALGSVMTKVVSRSHGDVLISMRDQPIRCEASRREELGMSAGSRDARPGCNEEPWRTQKRLFCRKKDTLCFEQI
ncbi:hypothetical protein RB12576 [Rhodopirellula baltica SH 1]|uniref:Uncharacterized protein n=2 Tax=Rhodopirellula baltica TaxID=265606 RepID=Q7UIF0_RHOBA|nr:hypothetical protein RB12576 [Rhodopirellula baltica SH 1]